MDIKALEPFGALILGEGSLLQDIPIQFLKDLVKEHQLVALRDFQSFDQPDEMTTYSEQWGEVSLWPFGSVLELKEQEEPEDHIFANSYVPMHWDGMYREHVPEYQIFHCVQAPLKEQGGRTLFSNSRLILENASDQELSLWQRATATYRRKMEFYDSVTKSPIIAEHPYNGSLVLRFNEQHKPEKGALLNPVESEIHGLDEIEKDNLFQSLDQALYSPDNVYAHSWQDGDIVIADNFTLLHGREAFSSQSLRHIRRVQVHSAPPYPNPHLESYK